MLLSCGGTLSSPEKLAHQVFQSLQSADKEAYLKLIPSQKDLDQLGHPMEDNAYAAFKNLHEKRFDELLKESGEGANTLTWDNASVVNTLHQPKKEKFGIPATDVDVMIEEVISIEDKRRYFFTMDTCIKTERGWLIGEGLKNFRSASQGQGQAPSF
jgi:hypothetical protein